MCKALEVAADKGASAVFSVRPLEKYDFCFRSKRDFRDLLALRYGKHVVGLQPMFVLAASLILCPTLRCV